MSILKRLEANRRSDEQEKETPEDVVSTESTHPANNSPKKLPSSPFMEWKMKLHQALVHVLFDEMQDISLTEAISYVMARENLPLSKSDKERMVRELTAEAEGFGPIDSLINDATVSEVMVNGPDQVYIERNGHLILTPVRFLDDAHIVRIIEKIVAPLGRRIDEASPMVDARLPDGSRVNAIIPPLSINGPVITIRKFSKTPLLSEDLIRLGTITQPVSKFLRWCVETRLNIVISGGTGSGKSTTLNMVSSFIPPTERVVTIEDAAELTLQQDHVITLETRPPNMEGNGAVTVRDLVRNSLRMRPDRIIVGEVRGGEALDMLQAMNTGHDGSLTTAHANAPRDCLRRLETMTLMAGMDLPLRAIREQVSSAFDVIVHQARFPDGTRKVTKITEVLGMEGDSIITQDLFEFREKGRDAQGRVIGELIATGIVPTFFDRMRDAGTAVDYSMFH